LTASTPCQDGSLRNAKVNKRASITISRSGERIEGGFGVGAGKIFKRRRKKM